MPRLLPTDWVRLIAINCLLQLYEREGGFVQEWKKVKEPFTSLVEQFGKVSTMMDVERLLMKSPPDDLIGWVSDLQKLRNYLTGLPGITDLSDLRDSYTDLENKLISYKKELHNLAYKWNLRAPWVSDELLWRDIQKVQQKTFDAAAITTLNKFSDRQIQKLLGGESPLSTHIEPIYPGTLSLYLSGGRTGYLEKLNIRLKEYEKELKASGVKEPPSSIRRLFKPTAIGIIFHIESGEKRFKFEGSASLPNFTPHRVNRHVVSSAQEDVNVLGLVTERKGTGFQFVPLAVFVKV